MNIEIQNNKIGRTESATLQVDAFELATIRMALAELLKEYDQRQYAQSGLAALRETHYRLIDLDAEIEAELTDKLKSTVLAEKGIKVLDEFWNEEKRKKII